MTCREYRENHPVAVEMAREHLAVCAECRAFGRAWELLGEHPAIEPGPRFLEELRRKLAPPVLRFAATLAAAAATLLVGLVLFHPSPTRPAAETAASRELREIAENYDLLVNLDVLRCFESVEDSESPLLEERK